MLLLRIRKTLDNIVSGNDTQFACLAQIRNPLSVIAQEDMRQATVEIGFGKIGIQSDCLVVIRQCRTVIFQQRQYIAAVIITVNKIGRQLDDMIQIIFHNIVI